MKMLTRLEKRPDGSLKPHKLLVCECVGTDTKGPDGRFQYKGRRGIPGGICGTCERAIPDEKGR